MAGTYIQQDVYGPVKDATPLFNAATMTDEQLLTRLRELPEVARARKECDWVVVTAMYQPKVGTLRPPNTATPQCWLAFVDRSEHATTGWTKVPIVVFGSYERNENAFKVMLPALIQKPVIFLNHALPQTRCFTLSHLIRGKEFSSGAKNQPHLLASKIPSWSGRSLLNNMLGITRDYARKRNADADLADLSEQEARMERAGFNASSPRIPRIADTLWMIWPKADAAVEKVSELWLHEVARFSSFEKTSYPWVVSQVPTFVPRLTDAIYVYSPEQKCGLDGTVKKKAAKNESQDGHRKRRLKGRLRRRLGGKSGSSTQQEGADLKY